MSTDGDERNTSTAHTDADGFPPEGAGQEGGSTLSRVVISRLGWVQRAVSPWVRRALETGQASSPAGRDAAGRRVSTALSYSATSRFLRRAQRFVEGSRSWQPTLGSLDPRSVARFTEEVKARFPDPVRHQVTWLPEEEADHATEFPLAGQNQPPPGHAAGEIRLPAMPASRSSAPQVPPVAGTARSAAASPTTVQRAPVRRAPLPRLTKPPPTGRLFSHVEELPVTRQEVAPEGDLDETDMLPGTPNRAAEEPPGTGEQVQRAVDAAWPSEEPAPGAETAPPASIQRQARSMPPAAGGDAGRRVSRQSEASRPVGPASPSRAGTPQQHTDEELQPPAPAGVSPWHIPPATQRAAEQQGAPQAAEPSAQGEAIERTASPPAPFPPGPDRATQRGHPERDQEEARTLEMPEEVAPRPAHAQLPPQERATPTAQRRATPLAGPEAARQAASSPPDQPGAAQQTETVAATQSPPVQEGTLVPPTAPQGDETVESLAVKDESGTESGTTTTVQREGLRTESAAMAAESSTAQDRPSIPPRAERSLAQRGPPRSAQAPSRASEAGGSLEARGQEQEQAGPQIEPWTLPEAVQRSPDQIERTAPAEGAVADAKASSAPEPHSEGGTVHQPASDEGVVKAMPGERTLHSTGAEERAPAAGRGPTSPPDAAALLPEAMQESSDQLPLATAPQASIQRGTVSGESEAEEPTGIEPEALSSAEGGPVVQRQPDRAAPPRSAATQRAERLPLAQREPAERGLSAQALPARGGREAGVATERAPTPADGGLGTGRELEAPGRDQPRTTRVDMGALVAPAREPPVSRTVQRTVEPPTSPAGAEPAPETLGKGEPEGLPGGGVGPENTAAPLQRQAVGQQRPASETLPPGVADMGGARPTPWREQPSRRPAGTEPGAGSERESSPPAARFVLPRPVVQTKSLADTAVLPQVRRAPAPGARVAQELPPPLVQRAPLPVGGEAAAGSGAVPAPVVPVTTLQPPPQLSGQAIVQRQPSAAPIISQPDVEETAAVQRAEEGEPLPQQQTGGEKQDLDRLAREVYPLVKRLLAIERERRTGRWG